MSEALPFISVVVPAFNEEKLIADTLAHIRGAAAAFERLGWMHEVIVCDNNSTDSTADLARLGGAKVVFEPVNQIGRARNAGAAAAQGAWLIFVDADSRPSSGLFQELATAIRSGSVLAGGATVSLETEDALALRVVGWWNCLSRWRTVMAGSFIFCEANGFREVGGFSAELFVGEELDLSNKLKRLAKTRAQRVVILDQHPLVTSPRKLHLYSRMDYVRFLVRSALTLGGAHRRREACGPWYDGRR